MSWVLLSLVSAVAFTAYSLMQKRTLDTHFPSAFSLGAVLAALFLPVAIVIIAFDPPALSSPRTLVMLSGGFLHMGILMLSLFAFQRTRDISRVVAVADGHPMLVLVFAIAFLGDVLTPLKLGAVILVVAGTVLAAWLQALPGERLRLGAPLVAMVVAAFLMATYTVVSKYASAELSPFQQFGMTWLVEAPLYLVLARRFGRGTIAPMLRKPAALGAAAVLGGVFSIAFLTGVGALAAGPVSLAAALMGIRPVLLVGWTVLSGLTIYRGWFAARGWPELRGSATAALMVTAGVAGMTV